MVLVRGGGLIAAWYQAVSIKTPALSVENLRFFAPVLLFTTILRKFESGVFNIYKIARIRVGGFIIYKYVPQKSTLFGPFFYDFPLNNKQKPQKFSRASRAGFLLFTKKIPRFARGFIIYKKNLPRFARCFYYLQNLKKKQNRGFS